MSEQRHVKGRCDLFQPERAAVCPCSLIHYNARGRYQWPSAPVNESWLTVDIDQVSIQNRFMALSALTAHAHALSAIAKTWKISRLSAFGSVVRDDFHKDSDVDLLVEFEPSVRYSLMDLANLKEELERLFHRAVDIVEPAALTNPYRRRHILDTAQLVYAA